MHFLAFTATLTLLATTVTGHSWLHCTKTIISQATRSRFLSLTTTVKYSTELVDQTCEGWPRNKVDKDDWIRESSVYAFNFAGGMACGPNQRVPGQQAPGAPMAVARPGQTLLFRFWGNGHSRWDIGSPLHRDPGVVRVYWTGMPNTEIVYGRDLTEKYWIKGAQANFTADAIIFPEKLNNPTMDEKANFMSFKVPNKIQNGTHAMVWVWAQTASVFSEGGPVTPTNPNVYDYQWDKSWGTCFDLSIIGSDFSEAKSPDILANQPGYNENAVLAKAKAKACSKTCLRGGQAGSSCTGSDCPPCWYMSQGAVHCYSYKSGTECPFPGEFICDGKIDTSVIESPKPQSTTPVASPPANQAPPPDHQPTQSTPTAGPIHQPQQNSPTYSNTSPATAPGSPAQSPSSSCSAKGFRGGMPSAPCNGPDCPPCRYKGTDGTDSCFEFTPGTQDCPFPNPLAKCKGPSTIVQSIPQVNSGECCKGTCLRAGNSANSCIGQACPPCWYKQNDGSHHCYEYTMGTQNCPFVNVTGNCKIDKGLPKGTTYKLAKRNRVHRRHL